MIIFIYVESIFCNYAIGSRNFSSGIILTLFLEDGTIVEKLICVDNSNERVK